jgi:hypothetical protein
MPRNRQTAGTPSKKSPAAADLTTQQKEIGTMIPDHNDRALAGSIGAHVSWANTKDRAARTAPARAALEQKFLDAADGDPVRAAHLRKAHFQRLALKSAQARRRAKALTEIADEADAQMNDEFGGAA